MLQAEARLSLQCVMQATGFLVTIQTVHLILTVKQTKKIKRTQRYGLKMIAIGVFDVALPKSCMIASRDCQGTCRTSL